MCKNCEFRDSFWSYQNVKSLPLCNEMSTSDTHKKSWKNRKPNFQQAVGSSESKLMLQWKNRRYGQKFLISGSLFEPSKCCISSCMQWNRHFRHSWKSSKKTKISFQASSRGFVGSKMSLILAEIAKISRNC